MCDGLTCVHCGQRVAGAVRWLDTHWRAAKVICLSFMAYPREDKWEAVQPPPASPAGCVRVLRVTCNENIPRSLLGTTIILPFGMERLRGTRRDAGREFPQWVAGFVKPLCHSLTVLHLRNVELEDLPALPLLVHLILEEVCVGRVLAASLQGLASLETLYISGALAERRTVCDFRACTRLRRVFLSRDIATRLAAAGQDLRLPPACTAALEFDGGEVLPPWLVRLGPCLVDLTVLCTFFGTPVMRPACIYAPQLSRLRHVTLHMEGPVPDSLSPAHLLGSLPRRVESLHLSYKRCLRSEQAVILVPSSLRALRVRAVCNIRLPLFPVPVRPCCCPPLQPPPEITFGLHAGLERVCLMLWHSRVGLQCLEAGAPTGLRELLVQARAVEMDSHLAAEVRQRGRTLERCDVVDRSYRSCSFPVPTVRVVHIGHGPVHMEYYIFIPRVRHWLCTCGACVKCLGPEAFGGVVDVSR